MFLKSWVNVHLHSLLYLLCFLPIKRLFCHLNFRCLQTTSAITTYYCVSSIKAYGLIVTSSQFHLPAFLILH